MVKSEVIYVAELYRANTVNSICILKDVYAIHHFGRLLDAVADLNPDFVILRIVKQE